MTAHSTERQGHRACSCGNIHAASARSEKPNFTGWAQGRRKPQLAVRAAPEVEVLSPDR